MCSSGRNFIGGVDNPPFNFYDSNNVGNWQCPAIKEEPREEDGDQQQSWTCQDQINSPAASFHNGSSYFLNRDGGPLCLSSEMHHPATIDSPSRQRYYQDAVSSTSASLSAPKVVPHHNPFGGNNNGGSCRTKNKRPRTSFTTKQLKALEDVFQENNYPSRKVRGELAESQGLEERPVKIWFQNRRCKLKRESNKNLEDSSQQKVTPSFSSTTSSSPPDTPSPQPLQHTPEQQVYTAPFLNNPIQQQQNWNAYRSSTYEKNIKSFSQQKVPPSCSSTTSSSPPGTPSPQPLHHTPEQQVYSAPFLNNPVQQEQAYLPPPPTYEKSLLQQAAALAAVQSLFWQPQVESVSEPFNLNNFN